MTTHQHQATLTITITTTDPNRERTIARFLYQLNESARLGHPAAISGFSEGKAHKAFVTAEEAAP